MRYAPALRKNETCPMCKKSVFSQHTDPRNPQSEHICGTCFNFSVSVDRQHPTCKSCLDSRR